MLNLPRTFWLPLWIFLYNNNTNTQLEMDIIMHLLTTGTVFDQRRYLSHCCVCFSLSWGVEGFRSCWQAELASCVRQRRVRAIDGRYVASQEKEMHWCCCSDRGVIGFEHCNKYSQWVCERPAPSIPLPNECEGYCRTGRIRKVIRGSHGFGQCMRLACTR